jgi:hypothetical protein
MNTSPMTERTSMDSPRVKARVAAVLYIATILTGIFAQGFISGRLVVSGDAAATAGNILAHRNLFELGFTVYLVEMACQIAMTILFYELLKPVNKSVALISTALSLAGCTIKTLSRLFYIAPLFVLGGAHYLNVFNSQQLQSLALLFLRVNEQGAGIALAFFGFRALLQGYLIFKSTFLPRVFGVLTFIAGLGWLTFLSPTLGSRLFIYVAAYGLLVAVALILWLLIAGVDEQRWRERASVQFSGEQAARRIAEPLSA